jgi:excisionase family DNA binding protein
MESNLANQLVVVTKADYEAMVHEQAHKEVAALSVPKSSDITCKGEVIKPIMCNGQRFLSRKDTAKMLDVGLPTLWRWNNEGRLKAIKVGGRKVYYRYDDVLAMLKGELNYDD